MAALQEVINTFSQKSKLVLEDVEFQEVKEFLDGLMNTLAEMLSAWAEGKNINTKKNMSYQELEDALFRFYLECVENLPALAMAMSNDLKTVVTRGYFWAVVFEHMEAAEKAFLKYVDLSSMLEEKDPLFVGMTLASYVFLFSALSLVIKATLKVIEHQEKTFSTISPWVMPEEEKPN